MREASTLYTKRLKNIHGVIFTSRGLVEYATITRSTIMDVIHLDNEATYLTKEHCVSLVAPSDLVMASPKTNYKEALSARNVNQMLV